jgi:GTP-binding protein
MEIISSAYLISNASWDKCPTPDRPEYAFIGRSNVGKSSLINMLCDKKGLAKTSATPGKTQLINHFEIISDDKKRWFLVDLPGYGYAKTSQKSRRRWHQMIEGYVRKRENLVCLFVLIDSRHKPQKIDQEFVNDLGKWEIPFALVFTKADKSKPKALDSNVQDFLNEMKENWEELPKYFVTSSVKKEGRGSFLNYIGEMNKIFSAQ